MNIREMSIDMPATAMCEELSSKIAAGEITTNQAREVLGLQPVDKGDSLFVRKED